MINTITIDFQQQQLRDTSFGYKINIEDTPIIYNTGVDNVSKTFVGSNIYNKSKIAGFDTNLAYNTNSFGSFNNEVRASVVRTDGKIVVVGSFTNYTFNGTTYPSNAIIILNGDGSVAITFPVGTSEIICVSVQTNNNKIVIGGGFSSFNGVNCNCLCRLNADGSVDMAFVTIIMSASTNKGFNSTVFAVHTIGNIIYVGGDFTNFNNNARNKFVKLNDGALASFSIGTGFNGAVKSILASADKLYIGGSFTTYKGVSSNRLCVINSTNASLITSFIIGTGFNGDINTLEQLLIGGVNHIVAGGSFTSYKGVSSNRLCVINILTGAKNTSFNIGSGFNGSINSITTNPFLTGSLVVGGSFTTYNGATANRLLTLSTNGTLLNTGNLDGSVNTVLRVVNSALTLVGGNFNNVTYGLSPVQSQTTIPIGATLSETISNTLTNLQTYNQHTDISYSIVGNTIEVSFEYDVDVANSISNIQEIIDYLDLVTDGFSQIISFDNTKMILAGSPFHIKYSAPSNLFDYSVLELYIWKGENAMPSVPTFTRTLHKTSSQNNYLRYDAAPYIRSWLEPRINESWFTNQILSVDTTFITVDSTEYTADMTYYPLSELNTYNECVWVRWILRSYKLPTPTSSTGYLFEEVHSNLHFATLGKGYHIEGNNSYPPSNTLIVSTDKYWSGSNTLYNAVISGTATNTNSIIKRNIVQPDKVICNNRNREFQIIYLNKWGLWDSFLFNKGSKRKVEITSDVYQFYTDRPDYYSTYDSTKRVLNLSAKESWTLNTGLLDEQQNKYVEELFMSKMMFLLNENNQTLIPVILTSKSWDEKLSLYDRAMISWTIDVENANNKINDIS